MPTHKPTCPQRPGHQATPGSLCLLAMDLPLTPKICFFFCLHCRQDDSHKSFLEGTGEMGQDPAPPPPHTPEGPECSGRTFLKGLLPQHPVAQGPSKVPLCPASTPA